MEPHEELLGADFVEHLVRRKFAGITPVLSALGSHPHIQEVVREAVVIGQSNPGKLINYQTVTIFNVIYFLAIKLLLFTIS